MGNLFMHCTVQCVSTIVSATYIALEERSSPYILYSIRKAFDATCRARTTTTLQYAQACQGQAKPAKGQGKGQPRPGQGPAKGQAKGHPWMWTLSGHECAFYKGYGHHSKLN